MAEAMLDDDYKLSHPDLQDWFNREVVSEPEGILLPPAEETIKTTTSTMTTHHNKEERKAERRSVVIQLPPKRMKLSSDLTAKQVVDGKSCLVLLMVENTIVRRLTLETCLCDSDLCQYHTTGAEKGNR